MWKWLRNLRKRVERPRALFVEVRTHEAPPQRHRYTGEDSGTQRDILHHLQYGPMTRMELDAVLDVTTAAIHLPLMVERGLVHVDKSRRPFRYKVAVHPFQPAGTETP